MMSLILGLFMMMFLLMMIDLKMMFFMMFIFLIMMNLYMINLFNISNLWMNLYSYFGLDNISMILIYLSIWILMLMYMVSMNVFNKKMFYFVLLMLLMFLLLSFSSMNYFLFYLFFEISLIPTFMLIMGWGYQSERLNASMFMFLYTMFSSLPLLLMIYYLNNKLFTLNYFVLLLFNLDFLDLNNFIFYFYMIFAFLVKLPIFMFHMWLPKAHVEAPVSGSMILAGVMLKLGGYGIIRSMMMMYFFSLKFNYILISLSLYGMMILSMNCLRQFDMKVLVAYSSVVHMAIMLMGLMSMMYWGMLGGLFMMIGHGLCSSGMFMMVNYFYERTKSRNMLVNKGMIYVLPSFSLFFFFFCICNMSSPPSLNLLSELMIVNVLLNWSMNLIFLLMISMYLSATYSLYLFSLSIHGKFNNFLLKIYLINVNNFLMMLIHLIPLNLLFMKVDFMI